MNDQEFVHLPVLFDEVVQKITQNVGFLSSSLKNSSVYRIVDCTLGGAGHALGMAEAALKVLSPETSVELIGFDQDPFAQLTSKNRLLQFQQKAGHRFQFQLVPKNFSHLESEIQSLGMQGQIHFLLADFGVSSPQLDRSERGFSFQTEGPLDMRMDTNSDKTCLSVLMESSESDLTRIFSDFGEEPKARKLAKAIVLDRSQSLLPVSNTLEFAHYVKRVLSYHGSRVHPATRIFQALRMEVNNELGVIEDLLDACPQALAVEATACFISFHSLEDRAVKQSMRAWQDGTQKKDRNRREAFEKHQLPWETQKTWGKEQPRGGETALEGEAQKNPRSRSARLRTFVFNKEPRI